MSDIWLIRKHQIETDPFGIIKPATSNEVMYADKKTLLEADTDVIKAAAEATARQKQEEAAFDAGNMTDAEVNAMLYGDEDMDETNQDKRSGIAPSNKAPIPPTSPKSPKAPTQSSEKPSIPISPGNNPSIGKESWQEKPQSRY